jgi:hypothetical protein
MSARGFSLAELLVTSAVSTLLIAALVSALAPARAGFEATPAVIELQQRSRLGMQFLSSALRGSGVHEPGVQRPPSSGVFIPAVVPALASGVGDSFSEFEVFRPVASGARGALQQDQAAPGAALVLSASGCPRTPDVCGFTAGALAAISDGQGRFDVFEVGATDPAAMLVTPRSPLSAAYRKDMQVIEIESARFRLARQPDGTNSLVRAPAFGNTQPIADAVVDLSISLWGEGAAPRFTWDGTEGWASYGLDPPAATFRDGGGAWPTGESCTITRAALAPQSRLMDLSATGTLVQLTRSMLDDGPWCAAGASGEYDADLVRLRRIDVSITFASLTPMLRSPFSIHPLPNRVVKSAVFLRNLR